MGSICCRSNNVWSKNNTSHISKSNSVDFSWIYSDIHASFLGWFCCVQSKTRPFQQCRLCLEWCRQGRLSLNPAKCAFLITSGTFFGHIVTEEGIVVDPDKVKAILEAPAPLNAKALSRFLGQIRWHSRMIRYLVDVATPNYMRQCIEHLFSGHQ